MAKAQPKFQSKPKARAQTEAARRPPAPPVPLAIAATKLQTMIDLLRRPQGASINDLVSATGWQAHSVRGAFAGALRRKGIEVTSTKPEGVRTYAILKRGRG